MRTAILSFLSIIFLICCLLGISTVSSKMIRKNELTTNTNAALEQTLYNLKVDSMYAINTSDKGKELISDFIQRLLYLTNSDSTIEVNVLYADPIKGLLDVEVTATYLTFYQTKQTVRCRRTILYDCENKRIEEEVA